MTLRDLFGLSKGKGKKNQILEAGVEVALPTQMHISVHQVV